MLVPAHDHRVSLVVTRKPQLPWRRSQVVLVESLSLIDTAMAAFDVERIIVDRSASADEFLHLLSALPPQLAGDVVLVNHEGAGFLSACGRGGDRVLYALTPTDVAFYIETHGLLASRPRLALTA